MRAARTMKGKVPVMISPPGNLRSGLEKQKCWLIITMLGCISVERCAAIVIAYSYRLRTCSEKDLCNRCSL